MRIFSSPWGVILALLGLLALLGFRQQRLQADGRQAPELGELLRVLAGSHAPQARLDLAEWDRVRGLNELFEPGMALPTSFLYPRKEIAAVVAFAKSCRNPPARVSPPLRKALVWHEYQCGLRSRLPDGFFHAPPFMHPSGHSFAWLAVAAAPQTFGPRWIARNVNYFHLDELLQREALRSSYPSLSAFPPALLGAVLRGTSLVENDRYAVVRLGAAALLYPRTEVTALLEARNLELVARDDRTDGAPRLEVDRVRTEAALRRNLTFIILTLVALLTSGLLFALSARRRKRAHEEARSLMLQTLTHELRTPVTGIALSLESFRKHFDGFSLDLQKSFLRLCDDVHRLNRLIRASTQYLRSHETGRVFQFNFQEISLNALVSDVLEEWNGEAQFSPGEDYRVVSDPYWLRTCLFNLLDNGARHGQPPIMVAIYPAGEYLVIAVRDAGKLEGDFSLDLPFRRIAPDTGHAAGLGFGLQIIRRIIAELGGELSFESHPTTFCLNLRKEMP